MTALRTLLLAVALAAAPLAAGAQPGGKAYRIGYLGYGENVAEMFRRAAIIVDKILKGAKPAVLPVEQPERFDLVVNLTTAKALGLTLPPSLLIQATRIIE